MAPQRARERLDGAPEQGVRLDRVRLGGLPHVLALVLSLAPVVGVSADPTPRERAKELTEASLRERWRADAQREGWAEAYDEGARLAEQAIAADPSYADAHYALFLNLGLRSQRTGVAAQVTNIRRLKQLLDKTIELDPCHADAWEARGEMLMQLPLLLGGSEQKGEEALGRSAECNPRWAKPWLRLAEAHRKNGDAERARSEAERARELASAAGDEDLRREAQKLLEEISGTGSRR